MRALDSLSTDRIKLNLQSLEKVGAIRELVEVAVDSGRIKDKEEFLKKVLEREELQSTGIGDGVAIPHAQSNLVAGVFACLGISKSGIEFDSLDDKPASIILLLGAQEDMGTIYLNLLSQIARIFSKARFRQQLLIAESVDQVMKLIEEEERLL